MVQAQASHRGSVVGATFRANLSATALFDFANGTDVDLQVTRPASGGTQIIRGWQILAEWLGPKAP